VKLSSRYLLLGAEERGCRGGEKRYQPHNPQAHTPPAALSGPPPHHGGDPAPMEAKVKGKHSHEGYRHIEMDISLFVAGEPPDERNGPFSSARATHAIERATPRGKGIAHH
jgi:hypothetical protein